MFLIFCFNLFIFFSYFSFSPTSPFLSTNFIPHCVACSVCVTHKEPVLNWMRAVALGQWYLGVYQFGPD